eukprot:COSAG06_NODE_1480_length_9321_cov_14.755042_6_plen_133_part_00
MLSLGEQQRLGLARMYYHSPQFGAGNRQTPFLRCHFDDAENDQFTKTGLGQTWGKLRNKALFAAVLDECTSAVSIDAEEVLYAEAAKQGVTTITISQRNTLPEFHTQHLCLGEDTASGCDRNAAVFAMPFPD